jgi:hypothetical protein
MAFVVASRVFFSKLSGKLFGLAGQNSATIVPRINRLGIFSSRTISIHGDEDGNKQRELREAWWISGGQTREERSDG